MNVQKLCPTLMSCFTLEYNRENLSQSTSNPVGQTNDAIHSMLFNTAVIRQIGLRQLSNKVTDFQRNSVRNIIPLELRLVT
jgi:hypothetical protein